MKGSELPLARRSGPLAQLLAGRISATYARLRQVANCSISANMTPIQCRMARAGLNWSVNDLASQSGVASRTIARFEAGETVTLEKAELLRRALVDGGALIVDVEGRPGVAVRVPS